MSNAPHQFYQQDKLILELSLAREYDTLVPYKYAANQLFEINRMVEEGHPVQIVSHGNTYHIDGHEQLHTWVVNVFNEVYNGGFEKYLRNRLITGADES
jgi:hypothetical protein